MPEALERKYPNAPKELAWQYIFPSRNVAIDPRSGKLKQHHHHESYLQKAAKTAIQKAKINKNASCHSLRHSFATHLLEDRHGIKSTIITSQLPVSKWHELIADLTMADAILDRLVYSSNRIELEGEESMRKKYKNN